MLRAYRKLSPPLFEEAALYLIRKMKLFPATTANRHV
jgi:hypothetical protein